MKDSNETICDNSIRIRRKVTKLKVETSHAERGKTEQTQIVSTLGKPDREPGQLNR